MQRTRASRKCRKPEKGEHAPLRSQPHPEEVFRVELEQTIDRAVRKAPECADDGICSGMNSDLQQSCFNWTKRRRPGRRLVRQVTVRAGSGGAAPRSGVWNFSQLRPGRSLVRGHFRTRRPVLLNFREMFTVAHLLDKLEPGSGGIMHPPRRCCAEEPWIRTVHSSDSPRSP